MSKELIVHPELLKCFTEQGISEKEANALLKAASDLTKRIGAWDELASIDITSIDQVLEMKKADKHRLLIKNDRLDIDKFVDSKRDVVQEKMSSFKKEDTAWLRVKQYAEKRAKDLEEKLKLAAEFKIRYEAEQKEILRKSQLEELSAVCDQAENFPLPMEQEAFSKLLDDMTRAKKQRDIEAAQAEKDRLAAEKAEQLRLEREKKQTETQRIRLEEILPFNVFISAEIDRTVLWNLEEKEYQKILKNAKKACEDKKLADEKAEKTKNDFATKVNGRIAELVSNELKFDFQSTYTGFGFFIDILDIKTYDDEKWTQLIDKLKEVVDNHKVNLGHRIEELVSFGTPVSEAMSLITLSTTKEEYDELLEEVKKTPQVIEEVVFPEKPDLVVVLENPVKAEEQVNSKSSDASFDYTAPFPPNPNQNVVLWVKNFKIPHIYEGAFCEEQEAIVKEICAKFDAFIAWSLKQIP